MKPRVALWYRTADQPPPYQVRVWVEARGVQFKALRGRNTTGAPRDVWAHVTASSLRMLDLADDPEWWRPENADTWQVPLPPGVERPVSAPVTAERVSDLEAAEMAREMEGMREEARVSRETVKRSVEILWWRDISQVRYEPAGQVSLRHCEGRLMRALAFCGAGHGLTLRLTTSSDAIAAASARVEELSRSFIGDVTPPAMKPLPRDRQDFCTAMHWFTKLYPPEMRTRDYRLWTFSRMQEVLLYRAAALPLSFAEIGEELGWSGHQRAQQVFRRGIELACRAANGEEVYLSIPAVDHIAELRARNRLHKRTNE